MNKKTKMILTAMLLFVVTLLVTSCASETDQYLKNDEDGYTVSVKYDANGGQFTTNTSVIVDSYDISTLTPNEEGMVEIALISPDSQMKGNDAFTATKSGYFLAGWYATRNDNGGSYTYSDKWDFTQDRLKVDADAQHLSAVPELTLYAAWVPLFEIEFYSLGSEDMIGNYIFNPNDVENVSVPKWNEESGAIEMYRFPERNGYTFKGAYYDKDGKAEITGDSFVHTGKIDCESGTAKDHKLKVYIDWIEGEWYRIYNAQQFIDNASVSGCYEIYADLDFEGKVWPTSITQANFTGKINGNGHTFKNISVTQKNNSKTNVGLFGCITEKAEIKDIKLDNVSFTVEAGTRVAGTSYGVVAGTISAGAKLENVTVTNSTLKIDSGAYFGTDDYNIGLFCGMGSIEGIDISGISCIAVGSSPDSVKITVNGNEVELKFE